MPRPRFPLCLALSLLAACASVPSRSPVAVPEPGDGYAVTTIPESFSTPRDARLVLDSIASWVSPEGTSWVISTAKQANLLLAFDGDSGAEIARFGTDGELAGPNGIAVFGDMVFVVERDAARISVFSLPSFEKLGEFGNDVLFQPYGLWLRETAPLELEAFVTDSYVGAPVPLHHNDQRVKHFRVTLDDPIHAQMLGAFGSTGIEGALQQVESIVGDETHDRLVVADEWRDGDMPPALRVYGFDGKYSGTDSGAGLFLGEPEGVALYDCPDGSGYWIAADQHRLHNRFHVFARDSLEWLGSFAGATVSDSDGIALRSNASQRFPDGVLYVADAGEAVVAFDWRHIADALGLHSGCEDAQSPP